MPKYIKKKALKSAIDCCTWYHINKNGELVEGANPADDEPLYKYSDIKRIIKGLPTRKFEDEPNSSEKPNDCEDCKHNKLEWYSEVCDGCSKAHSNYEPKDEPQTDCARR